MVVKSTDFDTSRYWKFKNEMIQAFPTSILSAAEQILKSLWLAIEFMHSTDMSAIG